MERVAVQEPRAQLIQDFGVPVHPVALRAALRPGAEQHRGHPVGEPDGRQGPVRQLVVLDHRVTGREDLVHHHGPLLCHRSVRALALLRVNPRHGGGHEPLTPIGGGHEDLLPGSDSAGENRRHPRGVAGEYEVRGGEGDLLARVGLDDVEDPPGGRVPVDEHDEVCVEQVAAAVRRQDPVPGLEVLHRLPGAVLEGDGGGCREAAT